MRILILMFLGFIISSCNNQEAEEFRTITELPELKLVLFFEKDGIPQFINWSEEKDSLILEETREDFKTDSCDIFQYKNTVRTEEFGFYLTHLQNAENSNFEGNKIIFKEEEDFIDLIKNPIEWTSFSPCIVNSTLGIGITYYDPWEAYTSHEMNLIDILKTEIVYLGDYAYVLYEARLKGTLVGPFPTFHLRFPLEAIVSTHMRYPELDKI